MLYGHLTPSYHLGSLDNSSASQNWGEEYVSLAGYKEILRGIQAHSDAFLISLVLAFVEAHSESGHEDEVDVRRDRHIVCEAQDGQPTPASGL